jgi:long-chain acyl-CoA synthetase
MLCYADRPANLLELFRAAISAVPDAAALIDEQNQISYRALDRQSAALARKLLARGLTIGDRIVVLTGNCIEFGIIALAAWRAGLVIVPLNPRNVRHEVTFVLNQCQAKALVFEAALADRAPTDSQAPGCTLLIEVQALLADAASDAVVNSSTDLGTADLAGARTPLPWHEPGEEDVAVLLYTSGTTGQPKGAMLTHLNLVHSVLHFVDAMELQDTQERSLLAVPISHVTGLVAIWLTMVAVGGSTVMIREFKSPRFLDAFVRHRVTHTIVVPAIYNLLLRDPDFATYDLSAWRIGGFGGAAMPETIINALAQALPGLGLMNAYGATETTSPVTLMPASLQRAHLDSVGLLLPCAQMRVVDEDGQAVAGGEAGELWIAGPMVVPGYWDNREASAREFVDGFWRSGDIGSIDSQGYVRVFDRKKDMINRGGYKVYSAEVEGALCAHPAVLEAAVFGQPDPVLGERTKAVIVPKSPGEFESAAGAANPASVASAANPANAANAASAAALRAHCAGLLADYKIPDFFEFRLTPLPRNPNGKVLKRELREARESNAIPESSNQDFFATVASRSAHALRGDYAGAAADFSVVQQYDLYTEAQQDVWRRLHERQLKLVVDRACGAFLDALQMLDFGDAIPRMSQVNERLYRATRWTLVPVPGLIPDEIFFDHLARRQFPVTVWIREPEEFDYIAEPDIFHDFFGHVPMLFNPVIADYLQAYGLGGRKAASLGGLKYLARLYWYTIEFGLIRESDRDSGSLRAYGAGILSSPGEIRFAIEDPRPHRFDFDLVRVMQTRYLIDDFQKTYFVVNSFDQLFQETAPDFSLLYRALKRLPELAPDEIEPGETELRVAIPRP